MTLSRKLAVLIIFIMLFSNFSVAEKPDIYIKNASIPKGKIYEGDEVPVNFTVGNNGDVAVNFSVALFVDNRSKVAASIDVDLKPGELKEETIYWTAEAGNHTLFIFADYTNAVNEENEDNNIVSIDVHVEKPKYAVFPPPPSNATWWDARWHYRVPLDVSMFGKRAGYDFHNKMVYCNVNFTHLMDEISHKQTGSFSKRTFNPNSVRVIEYENNNGTWNALRSVGREIVFSPDYDPVKNANVTLMWVMEGALKPHERRYYYIYWDTLENGEKNGEYGDIYAGIKNCEFEGNVAWKNATSGSMKWTLGYDKDPLQGDRCYHIQSKGMAGIKGMVWWKGSYAKVSQTFTVPDEGQSYYIFHGSVYVASDIDIFEWNISIDGKVVATGKVNSGWQEITANVTNYLKDKTSALIAFTLKVTQTHIYPLTEKHEVNAYIDSFWIETENIENKLYQNYSQGWDGNVDVGREYITGVKGKDAIKEITFSSVAEPKEVVAKLYSPKSKIVKVSLPLPDPSFESSYTHTFSSNRKTSEASIKNGVSHSGSRSVLLKLFNYIGKYKFENEEVGEKDSAGFNQNITYQIPVSYLPQLYFWYKIDKASSSSYLNYTLFTIGSSPLSTKIYLSSLSQDGNWHIYKIKDSILEKWRNHGGKIRAIEIRLIAGEKGAEDTIYIDDLGYSIAPDNEDRTIWHAFNFYNFTNGQQAGTWRLDVVASDASDYRITKSVFLKVEPSADLEVYKIDFPSGLKEGEVGKFIVYVRNNGPKSINESTPINVSLSIYQDALKPIKMRKSIAGLKKGESKEVEFEWKAIYGNPSYNGTWNVIAKINEENKIPDWNGMNDWYAIKINVEPRPDMEIKMDDINFNPHHPFDKKVNISINVHNIGFKEGVAKLKVYEKEKGADRYIIISNESLKKIIEGGGSHTFFLNWTAPSNGTFAIKVVVECNDEIDIQNNVVIKDIRIGGNVDVSPPKILSVSANPPIQSMGNVTQITATIIDNETSVDKAYVVVGNGSEDNKYIMQRIDETSVYYANITLNKIGEYYFYIEAWDTANNPNENESEKKELRIIYEGIETNPPVIKGVSFPVRQVLDKPVNISAYITDESGILHAYLHVFHNGVENKYEMKNSSQIFYYSKKYGVGEYTFYIEAIDASANRNRNVTQKYIFEIPSDYDMDGVPDELEIKIGSDPTNANDTINVSIGNTIGYLILIQNENKYIYWNKNLNKTSATEEKEGSNGGLDILFDMDGDGVYDHYYNTINHEILEYKKAPPQEKSDIIWIIPSSILFIAVGVIFIIIRRKEL